MKQIAFVSALLLGASAFAQIKVNSITATYNGGNTWPSGSYVVSQTTRAFYRYTFSSPTIGSNPEAELKYEAGAAGSKGQSIVNYNTSVDAGPVLLTYTVEYTGAGVPSSVGGTASFSIGRYQRISRNVNFTVTTSGASGSSLIDTWKTYMGSTYLYPNVTALTASSGGALDFEDFFPGPAITDWDTNVDPVTGSTSGFHLDPDGKYRATFSTVAVLNTQDLDTSSSLSVTGTSAGGVTVTAGAFSYWRLRLDSFAGYTP